MKNIYQKYVFKNRGPFRVSKKLSRLINNYIIETNEQLGEEYSTYPGVNFFDIRDLFCDQNRCLVYFVNDVESGITKYNYWHLTPVASGYVAENIKPYFTGANN